MSLAPPSRRRPDPVSAATSASASAPAANPGAPDLDLGARTLGMYDIYLNYLVLISSTLPEVLSGAPPGGFPGQPGQPGR